MEEKNGCYIHSERCAKHPFTSKIGRQNPTGETPRHILNMRYLLEGLHQWFASDPMVFVAGNMFVHYEEGKGNRHLSPDAIPVTCRGIPKGAGTPQLPRLGGRPGAPDFVIELTSKTTAEADLLELRPSTRIFSK